MAEAIAMMTPATIYVVAFVAGFTERLVLRAVEIVAGKASGAERAIAEPAARRDPAGNARAGEPGTGDAMPGGADATA
jgi:hypothetical protein